MEISELANYECEGQMELEGFLKESEVQSEEENMCELFSVHGYRERTEEETVLQIISSRD